MSNISEVTTVEAFQLAAAANEKLLVFFWAHWSQPCKALDELLPDVLGINPDVHCVKVEAEKVHELSGHLEISAVPTFVFLNKGDVVDKLEGFEPAELSTKVASLGGSQQAEPQDINTRIKALVQREPVMLFMKGNPEMPRCGFSRKVVAALEHAGVPFGTFDILGDEEVRQGLKEYSDWPTYPQLYAGGEMLGGCDIVLEMAKTGELKGAVGDAVSEAGMKLPDTEGGVRDRIESLLKASPVLLFMKGTPETPRCGFSSRVVGALRSIGVEFGHFDILSDEDIRQGVKEYSEWPTFPQLYANSELIGGCDIIEELAKTGELKSSIDDELKTLAK